MGASLVAQLVKNLPAMRETWVWLLGWEEPLEKGMAMHSNILTWRIPWTEEPSRPWDCKQSDTTEQLTLRIGSWLSKVRWGYSCASGVHVPESVKSRWLVCIHCEPRAGTPKLEKTLWLLCSILVSFLGYIGACLGWGLETNLNSFQLCHPFLLMSNFLSNKTSQN